MKVRLGLLLVGMFLFSATAFAEPPGGDWCNPEGYIHYCAAYCGYCDIYGGCCKTADNPLQYCLEVFGHTGTGCHDGVDDGCCGSGGLF